MARQLAVAVVLWLAVVCAAEGQTTTRGAVDWVFLVDTSKSMLQNDVYREVQDSLRTFVKEASDGDTVTLFTFDRKADLRSSSEVGPSRADLYTIIDDLTFAGTRTHLGAAIEKGLERPPSPPPRVSAIVLFTDGKEDVRNIENPTPIPKSIRLIGNRHVFFVSMGEHEEQLRGIADAKFIEANDAVAIRNIAQQIRATVKPQQLPPSPPKITIVESSLNFGELEPGTTSPPRNLTIESDKPTRTMVALQPREGITMPPQTVDVPNTITLQLTVAQDAEPGPRNLTIKVGEQTVNATATILQPSPLKRIAKWLALLAVLLTAALLLHNARKRRHRLEGELEIVKPATSGTAFVGLPGLKSTEVALSSLLPVDALAGSDARLYCRRHSGKKQVWISASSGSLRINDVETPVGELFDADTIDIGSARIRFNRAGYERPQEAL